ISATPTMRTSGSGARTVRRAEPPAPAPIIATLVMRGSAASGRDEPRFWGVGRRGDGGLLFTGIAHAPGGNNDRSVEAAGYEGGGARARPVPLPAREAVP